MRHGAPFRLSLAVGLAFVGLSASPPGAACEEAPATSIADLGALSIEELANIPVVSVSKRPESLSGAPAAIFVITQDDIRRSGATSIAEILRLAPNLQVAQLSASTYAITARGFNQPTATANKLLVLIDGRVAYSPLFSGVFWDQQNLPVSDIDRIEVISGPAGTLWGENAVNGVINIITKRADDTQGSLFEADAGVRGDTFTARHGGELGADASYRVYILGLRDNHLPELDGSTGRDGWRNGQGGFRIDWSGEADRATLQGDLYSGQTEEAPGQVADGAIGGENLLASWSRAMIDGSTLKLQGYYDNARRDLTSGIRASVDTFDFDAQYGFATGDRHAFVIGASYRQSHDRFIAGPGTAFLDPASRALGFGNLFAQDTISLDTALSLTLGFKLEHNSYTGFEYMPDARLAWRITNSDLLWASVSRAVRAPSRFDRDLINPGLLEGGPNFQSEDLVALEAGYRGAPLENLSVSVSAYVNIYSNLRTVEASGPQEFPLIVENNMRGDTYGLEAWASYEATPWWRLKAGASALAKDLRLAPGSRDVLGVAFAGNDPSYQLQLRSDMDLSESVEFECDLRDVAALPNPAVPGYLEAGAQLNWRIADGVELSLNGANLLHARHLEFIDAALPALAIPRSFYLGARWTF
ncbi:MAG TPA: TonB-dependent receptor [Rhizomicrobium sp.]|nr:TonB-dependent receptor [Rhizomicrobium sp.]